MALPVLSPNTDIRSIVERLNRLIQHFNGTTSAVPVASLIAAADAGPGARGLVTDATSTAFNAVAAGGGANRVPVWSDGTVWRVG